jgi:hypothetical protein
MRILVMHGIIGIVFWILLVYHYIMEDITHILLPLALISAFSISNTLRE